MVCILNIDHDNHNDDDDNSNDINNLRIKSSRRFNSDPLAVHMVSIIAKYYLRFSRYLYFKNLVQRASFSTFQF